MASAQVAAEEASVIQSERRLADSVLIAPSDGVVLTRARENGAIVSPGETVFALTLDLAGVGADLRQRTRSGADRTGHEGRGAHRFGARQGLHGQIGFISPAAEFTPKTVETRELRTDLVYRLRVLVDNPDGGLRQGMPVTVTLDVGHEGLSHGRAELLAEVRQRHQAIPRQAAPGDRSISACRSSPARSPAWSARTGRARRR